MIVSNFFSNLTRGRLYFPAFTWIFGGGFPSSDAHPDTSSFNGSSLFMARVQTFNIDQVCALQPTHRAKKGVALAEQKAIALLIVEIVSS